MDTHAKSNQFLRTKELWNGTCCSQRVLFGNKPTTANMFNKDFRTCIFPRFGGFLKLLVARFGFQRSFGRVGKVWKIRGNIFPAKFHPDFAISLSSDCLLLVICLSFADLLFLKQLMSVSRCHLQALASHLPAYLILFCFTSGCSERIGGYAPNRDHFLRRGKGERSHICETGPAPSRLIDFKIWRYMVKVDKIKQNVFFLRFLIQKMPI